MTVSMISRTCTHWRKAFLKSATSTAACTSSNINFTGVIINRISGSVVEGDHMLAKSIFERAFSTASGSPNSTNSNGEQAPVTPNLTPDKSYNVQSRTKSQYMLGKHRSNALELIQKQPVIEVDGDMAICDGGGGALGHPLEYIKLGARADYGQDGHGKEEDGVACIYCGLRYRSKKGGHHH